MNKKIKNLNDLSLIISELKDKGKKIVHCHGVFDLLHIGHIKHFEEAKILGNILVVSITPDEFVNKGPGRPAFTTKLRLEALAALEAVDYVIANKWPTAIEIIKELKPNIYCKGPDYKDPLDDITGKISEEVAAVNSVGGEITYTDDVTFSSSSLLNKFGDLHSNEQDLFIKSINNNYSFDKIKSKIEELKKLKVLIIGETIIDQYVFCEALGKSGKEPVLVLRDLETEEYLGGAIATARHLSEFCESISVLSFLGDKDEHRSFIENNIEENIDLNFLIKSNSPTIIKRRFVDSVDRKKILGVYSINDDSLSKSEENEFLDAIDEIAKENDLVIVADYGHGIITSKIANHISRMDKFVSLNAQVNAANVGTHNIRKYSDIDCLIINANELRHEMRQRDGDVEELAIKLKNLINAKYMSVTKGKDGAFLMSNKEGSIDCPAFANQVIDKIGSGDALLSLLSVCLFNGIQEDLSLMIASIAAAQSVESIGNSSPINKINLLKTISHFLK
jgi:rfaE bifunctional protein kinase chain/domain/rfaE bifunctional protein nucleotidyltransferase chain/domain